MTRLPSTGPRMDVLVVPGDAAELSPNQRIHHRERGKRVKRWRITACLLAQKLCWPKSIRRVRLSWVIRRGRALDNANAYGSGALKAIEDGLVDAGIIPDDSLTFVEWGPVVQETGKQWRSRPEVLIQIEEID